MRDPIDEIDSRVRLRRRREDFDRFAALGNDEWSYERVLPYFRRAERDLDFPDDPLHGADGPMPVHRALEDPHPLVEAFYAAAQPSRHRDPRVSRGPAATAVMIGERMAELVEHTPAGGAVDPRLLAWDPTCPKEKT